MTEPTKEPSDQHIYNWVHFSLEAINFYIASLNFYEKNLQDNLKSFSIDPDLKSILPENIIESLPISREIAYIQHFRDWLNDFVQKNPNKLWGYDLGIEHRSVRILKSVCALHMKHLRNKRNVIAANPSMATQVLSSVDQRFAAIEETFSSGIFQFATPMPLMVDEIPETQAPEPQTPPPNPPEQSRPRAVLLQSIQILDSILRTRCLDLFDSFQKETQLDRLDTVISEATRVLEDRLRALSNAPIDSYGADLASFAFSGPAPRLRVSSIKAEQEAAHLLFRGAFGLIRNTAHHRLLGELQPARVIQIVGFVDYLIHLAETAEGSKPSSEVPAA